jgi:hypothetical protein
MLPVRHISPFAFWLANPFQYPTPQRDIVYQNPLKINILYSSRRAYLSRSKRDLPGVCPEPLLAKPAHCPPKSADNQYFISIAEGLSAKIEARSSGRMPRTFARQAYPMSVKTC